MAEAPSWSKKVLCRYFAHGVCREGDNCRYAHDFSRPPDSTCRYYLMGTCSYGDKCRFDHEKPKKASHKFNLKADEKLKSKMVTLRKNGSYSSDSGLGVDGGLGEDWAKAPEFVPGQPFAVPSYADKTSSGLDCDVSPEETENMLCPFAAHGECRFGDKCTYLHGDTCDLCGHAVLFPGDEVQQAKHKEECIKEHEENMERSFAIARSKDKSCGICMEVVKEKKPSTEARFGILPNCSHTFCIQCIRKWRSAKQYEHKVVRSCPECRTKSDFVVPSQYWVDDKKEKDQLIEGYKGALSQKGCKYFNQGKGECPFNEKCFYKHAYPDGTIAEPTPRRKRHRQNHGGDIDLIQQYLLWDFLEERQNRLMLEIGMDDELDDIFLYANWDTDTDSDYSDSEVYLGL
ncbi:unnamed protein product [Owenia fusiformis]|uniref:RING-type E3 ubiquitin transferase n=1 Tax=Owenia fusiformis TaxID=6347 RepID=A0A8S4NP21_OWEFU|nr:unnamed protein product [Owenia fusiformis]